MAIGWLGPDNVYQRQIDLRGNYDLSTVGAITRMDGPLIRARLVGSTPVLGAGVTPRTVNRLFVAYGLLEGPIKKKLRPVRRLLRIVAIKIGGVTYHL